MRSPTTRLREAFTDPTREALLIDANNRLERHVSPATLTDSDVAATYPKPGLLSLDLDSADFIKIAERFHRHIPELKIVKCHSGGITDSNVKKQHWIICAGQDVNQIRSALHQARLPKQAIRYNQPLRPPGSPHRSGGHSELLEPDVDTACKWMSSVAGGPVQTVSTPSTLMLPLEPVKERIEELDRKTWRLIREGKAAGNYQSGETARFGLARRLADHGWAFDDYWGFLSHPDYLIGDSLLGRNRDPQTRQAQPGQHLHVQPHGPAWTKAMKQWNSAVEQSAQSGETLMSRADDDPLEHAYQVQLWLQRCIAYQLGDPKHRGTDRQVLQALAHLAVTHHRWTILPGTRQVAVYAGVGQDAVAKSIKRVEKHGMITVIKPPEETALIAAHRIILNCDWREVTLTEPTWEVGVKHPELFLPIRSAIWNQQALGDNARRIYAELTQGWFGSVELAERTRLAASTVRELATGLVDLNRCLQEPIVRCESFGKGNVWQATALSDPSQVESALLLMNWGQSGTLDAKTTRLREKKERGDASLKTRENIANYRVGHESWAS